MVLSGAEQHQQEMDDADQGLESCVKSVYYPIRRTDALAGEKFRLHKIRGTHLYAFNFIYNIFNSYFFGGGKVCIQNTN